MISFDVPGEPVPKGRPRFGKGHTYTPQRTRAHERRIWAAAVQAKVRPIAGPVVVSTTFNMKNPNSADGDNLLKCVLDALNGTAYADDRQVYMAAFVKVQADEPWTGITIMEMTE